jgi:hypothetical protein
VVFMSQQVVKYHVRHFNLINNKKKEEEKNFIQRIIQDSF